MFAAIIALTMYVTYIAAKKVKDLSGFLRRWRRPPRPAERLGNRRRLPLLQRRSSASPGSSRWYGYDGFMYSVGRLVAYITVLLVIAEPAATSASTRWVTSSLSATIPKTVRTVMAVSTITVSTFYLTAQMVGGGVLVKTLIGIDYQSRLIAVGVLMLAYVLFGGMVATTWVQIIKAVLLVLASLVLVFLVWVPYGFSRTGVPPSRSVIQKMQARGGGLLLGDAAKNMTPRARASGSSNQVLFKGPIDQISLGMALVWHRRHPAHPDALFHRTDRTGGAIGDLGDGDHRRLLPADLVPGHGRDPGRPGQIAAMDRGGNMAAPLLAQFLGGGPDLILGNLMLSFVAAVAFATIVAVVAGLVLAAASAMTHDIWVGVVKGEHATGGGARRASPRSSSALLGIVIGILAKGQNVSHLVALAFAVAPSANLPCGAADALLEALQHRGAWSLGGWVGTFCRHRPGAGLAQHDLSAAGERRLQQKIIDAAPARVAKLESDLGGATDPAAKAMVEKALAGAKKDLAAAQDTLKMYANAQHQHRRSGKAALPAQESGHPLDTARLPCGIRVLALLSRPAGRQHVGGALRAIQYRPRTGGGCCALNA